MINGLSKKAALYYHRKLWTKLRDWISTQIISNINSSNLYQERKKIIQSFDVGTMRYQCALCEYAYQQNDYKDSGRCRQCPVVWKSTADEFMCMHLSNDKLEDGIISKIDFGVDDGYLEIEDLLCMCDEIINLPEREDKK